MSIDKSLKKSILSSESYQLGPESSISIMSFEQVSLSRNTILERAGRDLAHLSIDDLVKYRVAETGERKKSEVAKSHEHEEIRKINALLGIKAALRARNYLSGDPATDSFQVDFIADPFQADTIRLKEAELDPTRTAFSVQLHAFTKLMDSFVKVMTYDEDERLYLPVDETVDRAIKRYNICDSDTNRPDVIRFTDMQWQESISSESVLSAKRLIAEA